MGLIGDQEGLRPVTPLMTFALACIMYAWIHRQWAEHYTYLYRLFKGLVIPLPGLNPGVQYHPLP